MAVDPTKYILGTPLQIFFIDKDTQTPLSGGTVTFYEEDQVTLKPVYKYVGTPGNPQFVALENPIILTPQGTIADTAGNDVLFYWFPYDAAGNWKPYFVKVVSFGGVEQFTRDGMPFPIDPSGGGSSSSTLGLFNYINNGQFLLHYDIPASDDGVYAAGQIRQAVTTIAYGDWTFERPTEASSQDFVDFDRIATWTAVPQGNPRYVCTIRSNTTGGGVAYKRLCYTIPNVNTFCTPDTPITFSFAGKSNNGNLTTIDAFLLKNYGTGGAASTLEAIGEYELTPFYNTYTSTFQPKSNDNKSIGTLDDDFIQIVLELPADIQFNVSLSAFMLVEGKYTSLTFVQETYQEIICRTLAGVIKRPAYDGSDVGGVLRLTQTGFDYSGLPVGFSYEWMGSLANKPFGYLFQDGSKYLTTGVSSEGIPYSRLYSVLGIQWGNGYDYLSAFDVSDSKVRVSNNAGGSVTPITDGTPSTGFTFSTINNGATPTRNVYVYYRYNTGSFTLQNTTNAAVEDPKLPGSGAAPLTITVLQTGNAFRQEISFITFNSVPTAGEYWTFQSDQKYYVWYTVDGAGTDPAPGGYTGIVVPLLTGDTVFDANIKTASLLNQSQLTYFTVPAASSIVKGSYFKVYTAGIDGNPGEQMAFYFEVGGEGSDPNLPGFNNIKIALGGSETSNQVADKTCLVMNNSFFQVPDSRGGAVAVGLPIGSSDPDAIYRYGNLPAYNASQTNPDVYGDTWGTYGYDFGAGHLHNMSLPLIPNVEDHSGSGSIMPASDSNRDYSTDITGRYRNNMLNYGVYKLIKY